MSEKIVFDNFFDYHKTDVGYEYYQSIVDKAREEFVKVFEYDEVQVLLSYYYGHDYFSFYKQLKALLPFLLKWCVNFTKFLCFYTTLNLKFYSKGLELFYEIEQGKMRKYLNLNDETYIMNILENASLLDSNLFKSLEHEIKTLNSGMFFLIDVYKFYINKQISKENVVHLVNILTKDVRVSLLEKIKYVEYLSKLKIFDEEDKFSIVGRTYRIDDFVLNDYDESLVQTIANSLKEKKIHVDDFVLTFVSYIVLFSKARNINLANVVKILVNNLDKMETRIVNKGNYKIKNISKDENEAKIQFLFNDLTQSGCFDKFREYSKDYCDCEE